MRSELIMVRVGPSWIVARVLIMGIWLRSEYVRLINKDQGLADGILFTRDVETVAGVQGLLEYLWELQDD
jgi:hypothetical protein